MLILKKELKISLDNKNCLDITLNIKEKIIKV